MQQTCDEMIGLLSYIAMRMKLKYNNYWEHVEKINRLLIVVTILDPQYKLDITEFWVRDILGIK